MCSKLYLCAQYTYMKKIRLIEIDSELGAGTRGASLGIGAMKAAAFNKGLSVFRDLDSDAVETLNHCLWEEVDTPYAIRVKAIEQIFERTCAVMTEVLGQDDFPLVLSGDHSTAGGTISGIKAQFPNKRLGVVWIDAHADIHTPYTTPSGNVHGMPLATVLQIDNTEMQRNTPEPETVDAWNNLKHCGVSEEKLKPEDLVYVAVRDTEQEEDGLMEKLGITNHTVQTCRDKGMQTIGQQILDQLSDCDIIYVSFDVDSMDCDLVSHGTGTPVKDGLTSAEAGALLQILASNEKVCCIEFVEVNPCLDEKINTMAETAVELLEEVYKTLENRLN